MKSVMKHDFGAVPRADIPRSSFNLSHGVKTTMDADYLVPVLMQDIIPGDTWNLRGQTFGRLATPLHPIMDNLRLDMFYFFVPNRILWTNWEKFCGAQTDPGDSIDFTIPAVASDTTFDVTSADLIYDYFFIPWKASVNMSEISAIPFRAYNKIWNDWFRDENLQDSLTENVDNGPDATTDYVLKKRGKRYDYFTGALPWPQKGDAVTLPIGTSAPITGLGVWSSAGQAPVTSGSTFYETDNATGQTYARSWATSGTGDLAWEADPSGTGLETEGPNIHADLSNATGATINALRLAFQTQRLLERDARSGTRYNETLLAHWGVTVPDFRLQRPEFLGGGSVPININPVANTSEDATSKQGDLTAFGTVSGQSGFTKSFVEHGVVIALANLRADITYSQGLERYYSKSTRYDFYYPVLSQIGEQSILNSEIFYQNAAADDTVFGYTGRYDEYRHINSRLTGLFRVDHASTLAAWHLSEDFSSLPTLGDTFIQANTSVPLDRAIAVNTEPHLILDIHFNIKAARPMPLYGVPGNLDRF